MLSGGELSKVFQPQKHCCTAGLKQRPLQFGQIKITNSLAPPTNTAKLLIEYNASVNSKDIYGRTALNIATEHSHLDVVCLLLQAGADPNIGNVKGQSIGADPNINVKGQTPLFWASAFGHQEMQNILLRGVVKKEVSSGNFSTF